MGSIDGLREQVEELKQRLNGAGAQPGGEPKELKARLASIKTSLETMQKEITQLRSEKDRLSAAQEQLAAAKEQLASEKQQLAGENEQLRKMLGEVMSAIDGQSADASASILKEFIAETDPLVKPAGQGGETVIAAGPPSDHPSGEAGPREQAARVAASVADAPSGDPAPPKADEKADEEEESPALRRIMKRGRRAG